GRAGCEAEAAMYATAQNGIGFFPFRCVFDEVCQMGLHGSKLGIHTLWIQDACRIELLFQALMDFQQSRRKRVKQGNGCFIAMKQRGMATGICGVFAYYGCVGIFISDEPAQCSTPLDQLLAWQ